MEIVAKEERGGECGRCYRVASCVFLMGDSAPGWALPDEKALTRAPEMHVVCRDCVTDEEAAKFLQPVAAFVLNELLKKHPTVEGLAQAAAFIQVRVGFEYDIHSLGRRALLAMVR